MRSVYVSIIIVGLASSEMASGQRPVSFGPPEKAAERTAQLRKERPHLRFLEGTQRGYVVLDVTPERVQADWFFIPTVTEHSTAETFGGGWLTEAGTSHLVAASGPVPPNTAAPAPPAYD